MGNYCKIMCYSVKLNVLSELFYFLFMGLNYTIFFFVSVIGKGCFFYLYFKIFVF